MKLNREHFRANIFYNFRRELTQQQYIDKLNSFFGDEAPSRTSVYRWHGEFNRGRSSLQDQFREGRPKSIVAPKTMEAVRQLILQDCHATYREIETTLGISRTIPYIQYCMNICLSKKFVRVGSHNQSIRVVKVLRQLLQTHAKVYRP